LIRNALSHGNVSFDDDLTFSFWDKNPRDNNETGPTFLRMASTDLGHLTERFYFAVSDVVYS
ncbi:MAG: hypothetical protein ACC619_04300, partial [Paracoccaceae bacterium]